MLGENGGRPNLDGLLHPGGSTGAWGADPQQEANAKLATASSILGAHPPRAVMCPPSQLHGHRDPELRSLDKPSWPYESNSCVNHN